MAVAPRTLRDAGCLLAGSVKKFEEILELTLVLAFDVSLLSAGIVDAPAEHGLVPVELVLLPAHELSPGLEHSWLVQQAVDDVRVHPILFLCTGFEVCGDVFVVLLKLGVHGGAEAASPSPSLPHVLDHAVRVRTRPAAMGRLVVLVESIGAPKALVTVGARVLPPSLVKLLLVPLPIEFALECLVT